MNNIYYVYMYLRDNDSENGPIGSPYYIGKGKENRATNKKKTEKIKPNKDKSNIRFIIENISEDEAHMWEEFWIDFFGRVDLGAGCLHNKTNGGEGSSGHTMSKESKQRMSEDRTGVPKSAAQIKKMSENMQGIDPATMWTTPIELVIKKRAKRIKEAWTDERKKDQSNLVSGNNNPACQAKNMLGCVYCKRVFSKNNFNQWHGDKCKKKLPMPIVNDK